MNEAFRLFTGTFLKRDEVGIALVSPRRELIDRLKAAFKDEKQFALATIGGKLSEVGSHFSGGSRTAIVIADIQEDLDPAIGAIEQLRLAGFAGAIITLSDTLDEASVRGLLRLHVTDWLPADARSEDIVNACRRALAAKKVQDRGSQAKCFAFVPAAGGVGTTTLAIQAAFLLAKSSHNFEGTCLVDLNWQSGAPADYIDLDPLLDLSTITNEPGRLDARLLEVMLARHATGLAVLAAPRSPADISQIPADVVRSLLSVVSETFAHMVLDLPPSWQPWTNDVLAASDRIFVVTEFTVPALRKAHELVRTLAKRYNDEPAIEVIVNKFSQPLFGGGLRKADAIELLGETLAGFIPDEQELVSEAINRGEPISAASRSNRITRELGRIVLRE